MNLAKMKELEIKINKLEDEIWKIKNPPKFKNGDMVESDGCLHGKIINEPYFHKSIPSPDATFMNSWRYEILTDYDHTYFFEGYQLKPIEENKK